MENRERRDREMAYITDEAVSTEMLDTRKRVQEYNSVDRNDFLRLDGCIRRLFGKTGKKLFVNPPFYCDYGSHIEVGENFYANYNCTIVDVAKVSIGDNVMLAPGVSIYTAGHPLHPVSRNSGYEYGIHVTIGNNVWIGGNSVVVPGVSIGDNVVIGAGSVVTKDIPPNVVASGNPCRVLKQITEDDKKYYFRNQEFDDEAWEKINK